MAANPPNPELAALPNLFLLKEKHRAYIEGMSPHLGTKINWKHYIVAVGLLLVPSIPIFGTANNSLAIILYITLRSDSNFSEKR